jgi:hypothetical protein
MADIERSASVNYSAVEKAALFLPCLRQSIFPKRNLFAGPFAGEFGLELMQWQGFVRARRPHYDRVHVLTYPGRDYLYEDCSVHYHDIDLRTAGYGYGLLGPDQARALANAKAKEIGLTDFDIFEPSLLCTRYHKAFWRQSFRLFTEAPIREHQYDVAFHFRAVRKEGPDQYKNYPENCANELVAGCFKRGLSVACIGHPDYSYAPPGCDDHRNVDLRQTVAAICSAHAIVGENSGPMHLANLCGKPTIIWANDQWRIDFSLRWNPFRVPIFVACNNTHEPQPTVIVQSIEQSLQRLRATTDGFKKPCFHLPAQQIAGY